MDLHFLEATNGPNWGKFGVGRFTAEEWGYRTHMREGLELPLLSGRGWSSDHLLVLDLQTGEGAIFRPGGSASSDLNDRHQIWVCPLFEPFLEWLYKQDTSDLSKLPALVDIEAPYAMHGHRRGPVRQ